MIPKVIHYCWFGGNSLPKDVLRCIESWKKMCPDYEIIQWNENNFDVESHAFVKSAYEAKAWAFVSDYARLKIIFEHGGIYLDTDVELLKSLDSLREYDGYIGVQQCGHFCTTGLGFGAVKGNAVIQKMLNKYNQIIFSLEKKKEFACPLLNDSVMKELGYIYNEEQVIDVNGIKVFPPRYFDPIAPGDGMKILKCEDTISIHHYSASWMDNKTKYRRKIIRIVGQENISKIKKVIRKIKRN